MVKAWQMAECSQNLSQPLTDAEFALLRHLAEAGTMTTEEYMLAAHLSKISVETSVVRLLALGMIEMIHEQSRFYIRCSDCE